MLSFRRVLCQLLPSSGLGAETGLQSYCGQSLHTESIPGEQYINALFFPAKFSPSSKEYQLLARSQKHRDDSLLCMFSLFLSLSKLRFFHSSTCKRDIPSLVSATLILSVSLQPAVLKLPNVPWEPERVARFSPRSTRPFPLDARASCSSASIRSHATLFSHSGL